MSAQAIAAPSLKRNLASTYGSQLYMALVGIVMLPFYVKALGVEAYGIVGLYIALQGWLALLDFGLSATLSRQAARFRAGATNAGELRALVRIVLLVFAAVGAVGAALLFVTAPLVVRHWLHVQSLPDREAIGALRIMSGVLALRFLAIPLRGVLTGSEDLQWLGVVNMTATTFRSVLVLPVMWLFSASLGVFFVWQLLVGLLEIAALALRVHRTIPVAERPEGGPVAILSRHIGFSLGMAATSAIWVAATNADKVLLSGLVPLRDYSMYSIATTAAGGVLLVIGPFGMALGPTIVRVHAEGGTDELVRRYFQITQLTVAAGVPAALALALFARQTLWAWTGNPIIAQAAAPVLTSYALGNGLLAISGLPLLLQIAAGRLKLQVIGTGLFALLLLPLLWFGTRTFGMTGAGLAWLSINLLFFVCWVPLVHRIFLPAPHLRWLMSSVAPTVVATAAAAIALKLVLPWPADRWLTLIQLLAVGATLLVVAAVSTRALRAPLAAAVKRGIVSASF
jgi:O-antigen/teichoic acid export membrane protein